jgi:2,4-dienoyl-CoA reductase-like NADH-dependent reductase (Old Yellow Enzyme family)
MPVFLRISATDWLEQEEGMESWTVDDTVRLGEILAGKGIDLWMSVLVGITPSKRSRLAQGIR